MENLGLVLFLGKSGAWFSYDSQRIGQGRENSKQFLRDNPEIAESIENKIRQNAGLLAEAALKETLSSESTESREEEL